MACLFPWALKPLLVFERRWPFRGYRYVRVSPKATTFHYCLGRGRGSRLSLQRSCPIHSLGSSRFWRGNSVATPFHGPPKRLYRFAPIAPNTSAFSHPLLC